MNKKYFAVDSMYGFVVVDILCQVVFPQVFLKAQ